MAENSKKRMEERREVSLLNFHFLEESLDFSETRKIPKRKKTASQDSFDHPFQKSQSASRLLEFKGYSDPSRSIRQKLEFATEKSEELSFKHSCLAHDLQILKKKLRELKENQKSLSQSPLDPTIILMEAHQHYVSRIPHKGKSLGSFGG